MDIDEAIDRVQARLRREGMAVPGPVPVAEIAAVEAELAPLRLPAEYRRLIERMNPAMGLVVFPNLHDPAFGLDCWRDQRKWATAARVLFTIAYASHSWLGIELASDRSPGGELYDWGVDGVFFHVGRLPAFLDAIADAPAEGPIDAYGQVWLAFDIDALRSGRTVGVDVEGWPAHWQWAEGYQAGDLQPAGPTATVAELLAARDAGPAQERVHVAVAGIAGTSGHWIATVADGTGAMVLRWPTDAGPARATSGGRFELEVRTGPAWRSDPGEQAAMSDAHHEASRHALAGEATAAQEAVTAWSEVFHGQAVDGEVVAARRLD